MSQIHVNQIAGYLEKEVCPHIDVSDLASHTDEAQRRKSRLSRALVVLCLTAFVDAPISIIAASVTDGANDGGLDLIHLDTKKNTLYIGQSKWHEDGNGSLDVSDVLKFLDGVSKVINNDISSLNSKVVSKSKDLESALYNSNTRFVLLLTHTGIHDLSTDVADKIKRFIDNQNDTSEIMRLEVHNQKDFYSFASSGVAGQPINLELQISDWGKIEEPYKSFYGRVNAEEIAGWFATYGIRLFDSNIRQVITSSRINNEITQSIVINPAEFFYMNNGITAICQSIRKKPLGGNSTISGIFECNGISIVNGAQTVGSIFNAASQNGARLAEASVLIRIIEVGTSDTSLGSNITRCNNNQNAIERRDFVALDPNQERIASELRFEGISYFYKTGSILSNSENQFDLLEATIVLACSSDDVSLAVQAKREIGKLWEDISRAPYKQIFNSGTKSDLLWQLVKISRIIDNAIKNEEGNYAKRDQLICIHGNRFIMWYVFQIIKNVSSYDKIQENQIHTLTSSAISRIVDVFNNLFPDSYPASMFKNLTKCKVLAENII